MTKVLVDNETLSKLHNLREPAEFVDEFGQTLGSFRPAPSRDRSMYENVEIPVSEEELDRIEANLSGRPLADILKDLEKQQ